MANYIVTTLDDELDAADTNIATANLADLSLREAIALANSGASLDTITFDASLAGSIIRLTLGELVLIQDVVIDGDTDGDNRADITISGDANNNGVADAGDSRIFAITGSGTDADLFSLTLTNGFSEFGDGQTGYGSGGAVYAAPLTTLDVVDTTISSSQALAGGGVFGSAATTTMTNVLLAGNHATASGGGAYFRNGGTATLVNTSVSGNTADGFGGGLGVYDGSVLSVVNSTVTGNRADADGANAGFGGGLKNDAANGGTINLTNSVVAGNYSGAGSALDDANGPISNASYSFIGTNETITANVNSTNNGGDAGLAALADNGGTVQTHALLNGSALRGAGDATLLPADDFDIDGDMNDTELLPLDANGNARVIGALDIGAVESTGLQVTSASDAGDDGTIGASLAADIADGGGLSLREAINWSAAGETITFDASLAGSTIRLTQGQLTLAKSINIDGDVNGDNRADIVITGDANGDDALTTDSFGNVITNAATNANTADNSRVFNISGPGTSASLSSLVVTGGVVGGGNSGGIHVASGTELTLEHASVAGNSAYRGGGIANNYGRLTVVNSSVSGNSAIFGGAIYSENNTTGTQLTAIVNTTISGNSANYGGGIFNLHGRTIVQNSTISGNNATSSGGGVSSWGDGGTFTDVESTIIAANTAGTAATADVALHSSGTNSFANSPGNNLIGVGNGLFADGCERQYRRHVRHAGRSAARPARQ